MSDEQKAMLADARRRAAAKRAEAGVPVYTKPKTPEQLSQEAREAANVAAEAAREAAKAADKINRRLPNPAPIKMIVGAPPPPRGNPRKFTPELQRTYFDGIARGLTKTDAGKLAGVSYDTLRTYRKRDPSFAEAEQEAESMACELIEEALFDAAKQGNVEAIKLWLFNRAGERWKPAQKMQIEMSGTVDHVLDATSRMERIASLEATLLARRELTSGVIDVEGTED
jgi:hypothetical protein